MHPPRLKRKSTRATKPATVECKAARSNCSESICLTSSKPSSAASANKASCKRSSLDTVLSQLRTKPPSCEESLVDAMRWQVLKTATKCSMNRLKGLLQDSKRCLAELRLETSGKSDLALSCAVYSRNHCLKTSLLSMIWTTERLSHTVDSKRAVRCESACQGFLRTCLAQWAKSRPTILTFGVKVSSSSPLLRRPRESSADSSSEDARSLTSISVI